MNGQNSHIGKQYPVKERFSGKKFLGGFNPFNWVFWGKAITNTFKTLIVLALIGSLVFGAGYWRGMRNKPVILGYRNFVSFINNGQGVEHRIEVKDGKLYFDNKMVKVSDVPQLKPYGIRIKPKIFLGLGFRDEKLEEEIGIGAELAHYFKWNLDAFGTRKAAYLGISYDLEFEGWLDNSSTGLALGKSWERLEDTSILWYWSIKI